MDLVHDEDLYAGLHRAEARRLDNLAHVVDAGSAGGVHLDHVGVPVGHDGAAIGADAAWVGGRAAGTVRPGTVEAAGDDARRGRLAGAAHAREHEGMSHAPRGERPPQDAHHGVLADEIIEAAGAIGAGEDPIRLSRRGRRGRYAWRRLVTEQPGARGRRRFRQSLVQGIDLGHAPFYTIGAPQTQGINTGAPTHPPFSLPGLTMLTLKLALKRGAGHRPERKLVAAASFRT